MEFNRSTCSKRLTELIEKSAAEGITARAIADKVGISPSTLSKYKNDGANLTINCLVKFADFFNVSIDYLLGLTDAKAACVDLKAVYEDLGLSEEACDTIRAMKKLGLKSIASVDYWSLGLEYFAYNFFGTKTLNLLLEDKELSLEILKFINAYLLLTIPVLHSSELPPNSPYRKTMKGDEENYIQKQEYYLFMAQKSFVRLITEQAEKISTVMHLNSEDGFKTAGIMPFEEEEYDDLPPFPAYIPEDGSYYPYEEDD